MWLRIFPLGGSVSQCLLPGQSLSQAKRNGFCIYNLYNSQAAPFTGATRWLCKGSSWTILHLSLFQGRNFKKAFIFYFFRALGLKTFIFFVSFSCLRLIIKIFCNTGNGLIPGNNLECILSALVLFWARIRINTRFLRYKVLKGRKLLQNSVYILCSVYIQRYPKAPSVSSYLQLHNSAFAFFIVPVSIVIVLF